MEIQAIIFPRATWSPTVARAWLKSNGHAPMKRVHKTHQFYRYRLRDPAEFTNMKTKVLPNGVHLIIGTTTHGQEGKGKVIDYVKSKVTDVANSLGLHQHFDKLTASSARTLAKFGDVPVQSITLYRTPIQRYVTTLLDIVSGGKFSKLQEESKYDTLFHLALIANVGGKNVCIEKNETIEISTSYKTSSDTETMAVPMHSTSFTLNELFEGTLARIGTNQFYLYDPLSTNCQLFIKDLLTTAGLMTSHIAQFVYQPMGDIVRGLPSFAQWVARASTDLAATARKVVGRGRKKKEP